MVPYSGASPAMQKAHILVATEDGTKLLRSLQAYCKTKKVGMGAIDIVTTSYALSPCSDLV